MKCLFIATGILQIFTYNGQKTKLPKISENGVAEINQFFQGAVDRKEIPGVVAIVVNRAQVLYLGAFGKIDVANDVEMQKDAIFEICSMTKPIASVAVMILYEEGRLDLGDPISKYIPSLKNPRVITRFNETDATYTTKNAEQEITIQHLLTHTSGFGYNFSNYTLNLLAQKTGKAPRDLPLLHEPGSKWTYGISTRILGELVEVITAQPLFDFFKDRIFNPLDMDDTFYVVPEEKYNRFVTMHQRKDGTLIEQPKLGPKGQRILIFGDSGLRSTAEDYITFLQMFLNRGTLRGTEILRPESIDMMTQNQIGALVIEQQPGANPALSKAFPFGAGRDKFGLGFQITVSNWENASTRASGSYSWSGLFNTHFWVDPRRGIAAIILMQVLPFYDEYCIKTYQGFEELIYRHLD